MEQWKVMLTSNGEDLAEVDVKEESLRETVLSRLLFVLYMAPLSVIPRNVNECYERDRLEYKLNHSLYMDDLKLFARNEEQIDTLVRTVQILL